MLREGALLGFMIGIIAAAIAGCLYCIHWPDQMAQTIVGAIVTAISQVILVLHLMAFVAALAVAMLLYGFPFTETGPRLNGEYGGFIIGFFLPTILMMIIARFIGHTIYTVTPERYWHHRSGLWNTFWFLAQDDDEQLKNNDDQNSNNLV